MFIIGSRFIVCITVGLMLIGVVSGVTKKQGKRPGDPTLDPGKASEVVPPPPPRPKVGEVVIACDVVNATVELSRLAGKNPVRVTKLPNITGKQRKYEALIPGTYQIRVSAPGYEPYSNPIKINAGSNDPIEAHLIPKFGFIELAGPELATGATVELDGTRVADADIELLKEDTLQIRTSRGLHSVRVLRGGFVPFEKSVDVGPGAHEIVAVVLERKRASLVVRSIAGVRVYTDGVQRATVPSSGEVHIDGLAPDRTAKIRLELDDYEPFETSLILVSDHENLVAHDLVLLPSSAEFSDTFLGGLSLWDSPPSWTVERGALRVSGSPGTGFPKGLRFRDCDVRFGLRLNSLQGASWMVRAHDGRNGYLFVLSGPESRWPNQLRTFTIRDGVVDFDSPSVAPLPVPVALNTHDTYRIRVTLRGPVIQHWLTPSSTGEELSIGLFDDKDAVFQTGNIGFAVVDREDFSINGFVVTPVPR